MPETLDRALGLAERAFMAIAVLAMGVMMLSISADALGRYLFNSPLQGNYEFTELYLMVIVTFMALPRSYRSGGQIRLEVLTARLARIPGQPSERINAAIGAAAFGALAWYSSHEAAEKFANLDTSFGAIQFPLYLSYVWVPVGCALLTLRLALEIVWPRPPKPAHGEVAQDAANGSEHELARDGGPS